MDAAAVEGSLKQIAIKFVTQQIMMAIAKKIPFLGGGFFGFVAGFFVAKIVTIAIEETMLGVKLGIIRFDVKRQVGEYDLAISRYRVATTDAEREVLEDAIKDAARKLIDFSQ